MDRPVATRGGQRLAEAERSAQQAAELASFVEEHHARLVRLAALICLDRLDAEDAVQNALLRAWRARNTVRDPGRTASWLDRIVVREAIRIRGRLRVRFSVTARSAGDERNARDADPAEMAVLRSAFEALPRKLRAVVVLHHYAGYSVSETALLLGLPHETARSRLRLARERIVAGKGR
ncbi:MAG: RNA polymerase sigma factor SigM [Chloroflexi bacterium]|nr:MAG: RNA polymerase sigma factor SigM [Chloroflexota bacterium]